MSLQSYKEYIYITWTSASSFKNLHLLFWVICFQPYFLGWKFCYGWCSFADTSLHTIGVSLLQQSTCEVLDCRDTSIQFVSCSLGSLWLYRIWFQCLFWERTILVSEVFFQDAGLSVATYCFFLRCVLTFLVFFFTSCISWSLCFLSISL